MNWNWKLVALALALIIALLGTLGWCAIPVHGDPTSWLKWFDLDRELNVVVLFSASLLIANGLLVRGLVRNHRLHRFTLILAVVFIFMALDESLKIHETSEKLTGIDWQILYGPVFLVAGLGWLSFWRQSRGLTRILWSGGAACWALSQVSENIQWGGWGGPNEKIASYTPLMIGEELLEMIGSSLFLLALFRQFWPDGLSLGNQAQPDDREATASESL